MLQEHFGIPQVSTGDMFRHAAAAGTTMGKEAESYMNSGKLVPDELVIGMVQERLKQPDARRGFLLDGFPRTKRQAEMLSELLTEMRAELDRVILITLTCEEIISRLGGRRTCNSCGAVFHVQNRPPANDNTCDFCGGELRQRADDTEETVRQRMRVYEESTAPLIEYYRERGLVTEVDGAAPLQKVFDRIIRAL